MSSTLTPTGPQTTGKAWAAAITTFLTVGLASFGFGDLPPEEEVVGAIEYIVASSGASAIAFAATWYKANFVVK